MSTCDVYSVLTPRLFASNTDSNFNIYRLWSTYNEIMLEKYIQCK